MYNKAKDSLSKGFAYLRKQLGNPISSEPEDGQQNSSNNVKLKREESSALGVAAEGQLNIQNDVTIESNVDENIPSIETVASSPIFDSIKRVRMLDEIKQSEDGRDVFVFGNVGEFVHVNEMNVVNENDVLKVAKDGELAPYKPSYQTLIITDGYPYKRGHGPGLVNQSFFCYANAFLQCIFNLNLFKDLIMSQAQFKCIHGFKNESTCLLCFFRKALPSIYNGEIIETYFFGLYYYIEGQMIKADTSTNAMRDTSEFGLLLLELLEKCFINMVNDWSFYHINKMDNPVCQVFSTTMRDTTLCDLMGHESNHFFTDFFLEVPILKYYQTPDGVFAYPLENIYECLNEKFTVEDIEFRCSQCDEEEPQCKNECRGGKKIHKMSKPAKVLFIKLNRVDDMDPTTKIESSVEFPIMLDVSEYTVNDQTAKYQLNSIILHDSAVNSSEGGHYITVTRNDKNQYYYMDDSRKPRLINFETERESLYKQACFLSYVLVESGEVEEKQYSYIELAKNHLKKDKVDTVTNKNKLNKKKLNKKNLGQILRAKKRRPEDDDQSQTEKSVKKVFKN